MSVYEGIMKGLGEALEHAEGRRDLRTETITVKNIEPLRDYNPDEIKQIRANLGMTQIVFAGFMGVSKKTVEAWEAGRNAPDGPARRILALAQNDPQFPERSGIVTSA